MSSYYVACELGMDRGRVVLGTFCKDQLTLSETRRFQNVPLHDKEGILWNIPQLYQETLEGLRSAGSYDEPVDSISCHSWAGDYLLFESDGTLVAPAYHPADPRAEAGRRAISAKVPREIAYEETGFQTSLNSTLCQLGAESFRRLTRATHMLPIADAFNYLLAGVPRVEVSQASATQLYNPVTGAWSQRLVDAMRLPGKLLPEVVPAGTELGSLRPEIGSETRLDDARVVTSCSYEIAAAVAGLPVTAGEDWAYLRPGSWTVMGTQLPKPIINQASREMDYTNQTGYGGAICFQKQAPGMWLLEECLRSWESADRGISADLLPHLAGSSTPFESLINPADPRFQTPGDMPRKIQDYCKETRQVIPRKPGPIYRCILESLALMYRRMLQEMEYLTGKKFARMYLLDGGSNNLLNHFIANAVQLPVVVGSADSAAIGNIVIQAMALGHLKSLDEARELVRRSFKTQTILPHAAAWNVAYERLVSLALVK